MNKNPPFTITSKIIALISEISSELGRISIINESANLLRLRRINQIRSVQGSLAIEGNTLTVDNITAILDGKKVIAPAREIQEARNALNVYERLLDYDPLSLQDLLSAHKTLMTGLVSDAGVFRKKGAGVMSGENVIHMAPPASLVHRLMGDLFSWLKDSDHHSLIKSCVFHYEFEFIHPFTDGNGRMGRLWQTLILSRWNPLLKDIPVESLIYENQSAYYEALAESTQKTDSAPFIEFMLGLINSALLSPTTPEVTPEVAPEVKKMLGCISGSCSRREIQQKMGLKDEKHFREHYLRPALAAGLIKMTRPDHPRSRLQKYRMTPLGLSSLKSP